MTYLSYSAPVGGTRDSGEPGWPSEWPSDWGADWPAADDRVEEDAPTQEFPALAGTDAPRRHRLDASEHRVAAIAGALAAAILVTVLVVTVAGGTDYRSLDTAYFGSLRSIAVDSQAVGRTLARELSAGASRAAVAGEVSALLRRQRTDDARLQGLSPPPRLRGEDQGAIYAFGLRTDALAALATGLRDSRPPTAAFTRAGEELAASDVLWQSVVANATAAELAREHVTGLAPPLSTFERSGAALATSTFSSELAQTWSSSTVPLTTDLRSGARGPAVASWQSELRRWQVKTNTSLGVQVTGVYDAATAAATSHFQTAMGIAADGVAGPITRAAMAKSLATPIG
jgi:hypothetical protein